jgi:hypothetical protein
MVAGGSPDSRSMAADQPRAAGSGEPCRSLPRSGCSPIARSHPGTSANRAFGYGKGRAHDRSRARLQGDAAGRRYNYLIALDRGCGRILKIPDVEYPQHRRNWFQSRTAFQTSCVKRPQGVLHRHLHAAEGIRVIELRRPAADRERTIRAEHALRRGAGDREQLPSDFERHGAEDPHASSQIALGGVGRAVEDSDSHRIEQPAIREGAESQALRALVLHFEFCPLKRAPNPRRVSCCHCSGDGRCLD